MSDNVSILIKTFERPNCLKRLLTSIRSQGMSRCPVLIADDSKTPYRDDICSSYGDIVDEYVVLPFNVGVSAGRNALLERVETDYFVLNDDDFIYGESTRFDRAVSELEAHQFDILGGPLLEWKRQYLFPSIPQRIADALHLYREGWEPNTWVARISSTPDGGVSIKQDKIDTLPHTCDLVLNFFVARTDAVRDTVGGWHPSLTSTGEHWEFFYRCKEAGLDVGYTDQFSAFHHAEEVTAHYNSYRYNHEAKLISKSLEMHGFQYLKRGSRIIPNQLHTPAETSLEHAAAA